MRKFRRSVLVLALLVVVLFLMSCGGALYNGAVLPMPAGGSFTGSFYTTHNGYVCDDGSSSGDGFGNIFGYAEVEMVQIGDRVTGRIHRANLAGPIEGTVQGNVLQYSWTSNDRSGHGYFLLQPATLVAPVRAPSVTAGVGDDPSRDVDRVPAWSLVNSVPEPVYGPFTLRGQRDTGEDCHEAWDAHQIPQQYVDNPSLDRSALPDTCDLIARGCPPARSADTEYASSSYAASSGGEAASTSDSEAEERESQRETEREERQEERRQRREAESQASDERLRAAISGAIRDTGAGFQATLAESARRQQLIRDQQRQSADEQRQREADRQQQASDQRADQQRQQADRQRQQADQQREQADQQRQQAERQRVADVQQRISASHASTPLGTSAPRDMTFCTTMTVRSIPSGAVIACGQYGEIRVSLHNNCTERVTCELEFPGNEENNTTTVVAIPPGGTPVSGPGDGTYQCYRQSAPPSSTVHATCHTTCAGGQEYRGMGICACPSRTDDINGLCYPACPSGSHRNYSNNNCDSD